MFSVISFQISDEEKAKSAFEIRQRVFVDEQKVDRDEEYDSHEAESTHYLLLKDEQPIGTARRRFTDKGMKLERFAVLTDQRNNGAGAALLQQVLKDILPADHLIYLHAQVPAMRFYLRAGFVPEGELFYEANIPHYKMTYKSE